MGGQSEARKLMILLDLISIDQDKDKLSDLAREEIFQTKEYKILQNLSDYYFISEEAQSLKEELSQINFDNKSVKDIYKEYDHLTNLIHQRLNFYLRNTKKKIKDNQYHFDVLAKENFSKIEKKKETDLTSKFISILVESGELKPVHAFRKYLTWKTDKDVQQEYLKLRDHALQTQDLKRQKLFSIVGFMLCSIIFPFVLQSDSNQTSYLAVIGILLGLTFIYGFISKKPYFMLINSLVLLMTAVTLIAFTVLQLFNKLTLSMDDLIKIGFLEATAILGGVFGILLSRLVNKLPKVPFQNPNLLTSFYKNKYVLSILLVMYSFIWISAFSTNQTVPKLVTKTGQNFYHSFNHNMKQTYHTVASKVSMTFTSAAKVESVFDGDEEELQEGQPIGKIEVVLENVNVRTAPSIHSEVYTVVHQGERFLYFGSEMDDKNREWYKLMSEETNEYFWISSKTVQIVE